MLSQYTDGGARRLVVDVTSASDDVDIAYAFARRKYILCWADLVREWQAAMNPEKLTRQ